MSQARTQPDEREALIQWIKARVAVPSFQASLERTSLEDLRALRVEIERSARRFSEKGRLASLAENDDEAFAALEGTPHAAE